MNLLQKKLLKIIREQDHSVKGTPQFEACGETYSIVVYSLTTSEEYKAFLEQKNATLFDIDECEFLNWGLTDKQWNKLRENDELLGRVQRILTNIVEAL